jgi:hypothetical protein
MAQVSAIATMISTKILFLLLLILLIPSYSAKQPALAQADASNGNNNGSNTNPGAAIPATGSAGAAPNFNGNSSFFTYENHDFGFKMKYPSNWIKQEDNLLLHTIAAFELIHENIYDFTNTTLAELDLRVYTAPQNETYAKLNISQINTQGQMIISHYKNDTTTLGGLPALRIINYYFGDITRKEMQVWTFIPSKHVLVELVYIAQPPNYSRYLPVIEKMIGSVELAK